MATVGQQLLQPESGWKRYDDTDSFVKYDGEWSVLKTPGTYNNTRMGSNNIKDRASFKFKGTKLRLLGYHASSYSNSIGIKVDGVEYTFSQYSSEPYPIVLSFELTDLDDQDHTVEMYAINTGWINIDAIDIDADRELIDPTIKTRLEDMEIGDKIISKYVAPSGQVGVFSELGTSTDSPIPNASSATPNGSFYWIKVDEDFKGRSILVAEKNIQHSINWDSLNTAGVSTTSGVQMDIGAGDDWKTNIRLLTGGTSSSTAANSEWDKYIVNGTIGSDNTIWNWSGIYSWTSTTSSSDSTRRTIRGSTGVESWVGRLSDNTSTSSGFRPVLVAESLADPTPPTSFLIKDSEEVKTYFNGWQTVADSSEDTFLTQGITNLSSIPASAWNELGETFEVLQYVSDSEYNNLSFETEIYTPFDLLGESPKVLMYSDEESKSSASANLTALPHGQLVFQEGDIDVSGGVERLTLNTTSSVKVILSSDKGNTWYTLQDSSWQLIIPSKEFVQANGMTPEGISNLTKEDIDSLLGESNTLRFAYYLEQDSLDDTVSVNAISITPSPVATETPSIEEIRVDFDEYTIEGRLKDLEEANVINMAKLNFKANALTLSEKYALHDLVIDTLEDIRGVAVSSVIYDEVNKSYTGQGEIIFEEETLNRTPHSLWIVAEGSNDVTFRYSANNGSTWTDLPRETVHDVTEEIEKIKIKAILPSSSSTLSGIALGWA